MKNILIISDEIGWKWNEKNVLIDNIEKLIKLILFQIILTLFNK